MNISSVQTDYLNLERSSDFGRNSERENTVQTKCTFCGGTNHSSESFFKRIRLEKEKSCASSHSDNRGTERTSKKCFRCRSEDHLITKFPKSQKYYEKRRKQVRFNEKGNRARDNSKKTVTKIYIHICHSCLVMANVLVEILVTIHNRQIGFWILEQRVT